MHFRASEIPCYAILLDFIPLKWRKHFPMLDIMRRQKRLKLVLWIVIIGLCLGMALFFVPGGNMGEGSSDSYAATVDKKPITLQEFRNVYNRTLDSYTNGQRSKIPAETLKALGFSEQILNSLISRKVVEVIGNRLGVAVTDKEVQRAIETIPGLQDQNGKFVGIAEYKNRLANNNLSVEQFEESVRSDLFTDKVRGILTDSLEVSDRELRDEFSRTSQQTVADYVVLKKEEFKKRIKPSEAELRAYFDAHKENYRIREKRRAQYLLVRVSQFIPAVEATEQEIQKEWRSRPHPEMVQAAHILFKVADPSKEAGVKAKAESVLKEAKAGAAFAGLAKKYSDDTENANQGGILAPFQKGQKPQEFEDAAFSLKEGDVSNLVQTSEGFHIIKVLRHEVPTLQSSHEILASMVKMKKAQELAKQKAEQAASNAQKQKDFVAAVKDLGIQPETSETALFGKDDNPYEIGISEALRNEVFELKNVNSTGKAVEHQVGYAIPKLLEVQMPKPGDFSLSRNQVESDYTEAKAGELMKAEAKKLSEEAGKQSSLEKAAKGMGFSSKTSQPFNFTGNPGAEIGSNPQFNQTAFNLAPGGISEPFSLLDNMTVLQVKSRTPFDESAFKQQVPELRTKLLQAIQTPYFQEYVRKATEDLDKAGKIVRNQRALDIIHNNE
jgi:peptidyl-prolyl cis-trans isomerase D